MIEAFKKGFYTTSLKKERNQETTFYQSSYTKPQYFSTQQSGIQQEKQKQPQKLSRTKTPTLEEQPRKQMKFTLHQEMNMDQLIKMAFTSKQRSESSGRRMRSYHSRSSMDCKIPQNSECLTRKGRLMPYGKISKSNLARITPKCKEYKIRISRLKASYEVVFFQQIPLYQINFDKMEIEKNSQQRKQLNQNQRFRNYASTVKVNNTFGRIVKNLEKSRRNLGRNNQIKQAKGKTRYGATKTGQLTD